MGLFGCCGPASRLVFDVGDREEMVLVAHLKPAYLDVDIHDPVVVAQTRRRGPPLAVRHSTDAPFVPVSPVAPVVPIAPVPHVMPDLPVSIRFGRLIRSPARFPFSASGEEGVVYV